MKRTFLKTLASGTKRVGAAAIGIMLLTAGVLNGQTTSQAPKPLPKSAQGTVGVPLPNPAAEPQTAIFDPMITPASGCCGTTLRGSNGGGCGSGGSYNCFPGRKNCGGGAESNSICGRLFGGLFDELCCTDPCYEPRWVPEANAAFFSDSPRPVTQTRIRWDSVYNYRFPDTAEFFWAKIGGKGPANTPSLRYNDLTFYQETASGGASFFIEMAYRNIEPQIGSSAAGFGDMNLGTKAVLLDREMLLVTMQFRTYIPTGNFKNGLGTGHTALEPSLLAAVKLTPNAYLQTQLSEWIPLGGTDAFASSVFHYHFSWNQNLLRHGPIQVIGTAELSGYTFQGAFTDFPAGVVGNNGSTYLNAGPGVRLQVCDNFDLGFAAGFGFGNDHGPGTIYRTELRIRY